MIFLIFYFHSFFNVFEVVLSYLIKQFPLNYFLHAV